VIHRFDKAIVTSNLAIALPHLRKVPVLWFETTCPAAVRGAVSVFVFNGPSAERRSDECLGAEDGAATSRSERIVGIYDRISRVRHEINDAKREEPQASRATDAH
jgi:hypothetical protein